MKISGSYLMRNKTTGFSLLEVIIAMAIFATIFLVIFMLLQATQHFTNTGESQIDLQEYGRKAIERMTEELRQAGRIPVPRTNPGRKYPRFGNFSSTPAGMSGQADAITGLTRTLYAAQGVTGSGVPSGYGGATDYFAHAGLSPSDHVSNNPEFMKASREVIFLLPDTTNATATTVQSGVPVNALGEIVWDPAEIGYIVTRGADGINELQRRQVTAAGGTTEVVARYVERITVEDAGGLPDQDGMTVPPYTTLNNSQLRLTVFLARRVARTGSVLEAKYSTILVMRNNSLEY